MILPILPDVLFDEFPEDDSIEYCIFTRPKYPDISYGHLMGKVKFYFTQSTAEAMATIKDRIPVQMCREISAKKTIFNGRQKFSVRCIPTGSVTGSVMLLISIEDKFYLYTGQFSNCREILLNKMIKHSINRLEGVFVDNNTASLNIPPISISNVCKEILEIVDRFPEYKINLETECFGYEKVVYALARFGVRVRLVKEQLMLFDAINHSNLFVFDEEPQIRTYIPSLHRQVPRNHYKGQFQRKRIHIKLVISEYPLKDTENIDGLFLIRWTPHPTKPELEYFLSTLNPKHVYPLMPDYFNGLASIIEKEKLKVTDGCGCLDNTDTLNEKSAYHISVEKGKKDFLDESDELSCTEITESSRYSDDPQLDDMINETFVDEEEPLRIDEKEPSPKRRSNTSSHMDNEPKKFKNSKSSDNDVENSREEGSWKDKENDKEHAEKDAPTENDNVDENIVIISSEYVSESLGLNIDSEDTNAQATGMKQVNVDELNSEEMNDRDSNKGKTAKEQDHINNNNGEREEEIPSNREKLLENNQLTYDIEKSNSHPSRQEQHIDNNNVETLDNDENQYDQYSSNDVLIYPESDDLNE